MKKAITIIKDIFCATFYVLFGPESRSKERYKNMNGEKMKINVFYTGEYPNLCSGKLIIEINNKFYDFGKDSLSSGGCTYFTNGYEDSHIEIGEWKVRKWPKSFPEELKEETLKAINIQISYGCCGGCL